MTWTQSTNDAKHLTAESQKQIADSQQPIAESPTNPCTFIQLVRSPCNDRPEHLFFKHMAHREPLAGADIAWLRMEHPTNLMMICGVMMFDQSMAIETLKAMLEERLLIHRRFRQRIAYRGSTPYWEDDPLFDIGRHVHRVALPGAGGQKELQDLTSDLMSTPLDFSKPLWQMHLAENYDGGCALIVRLHHCIGDGIALIHVLISMADEYYDPRQAKALDRRAQKPKTGLLGSLLKPVARVVTTTMDTAEAVFDESARLLTSPRHLLKRAKQGMSIGAATSRLLLLPADSDTLFKGTLSAGKCVAWSQPIPLKTIKAMGKRADAKINDVLVAATAGALRRYLHAHGEPVDEVEIRATIPVNLRPLDDAHKLGNHFGLVFLTLPIHFDDPAARLQEVKARMDRLKGSAEAGVVFGLLQIAGNSPEAVQNQLVELLEKKATAVLTNVPGPRETLHLDGHRLTDVMFWVPQAGNLSLGISILSYAGHVLLGIATDARLVRDPDAIVAAFQAEYEALHALLLA